MRIAFNRKNKTLHALFTCSSVLEMLQANYKTHCALNNIAVDENFQIKLLIEKILTESDFSDKRSSKLDMDDFLRYDLSLFVIFYFNYFKLILSFIIIYLFRSLSYIYNSLCVYIFFNNTVLVLYLHTMNVLFP